MLELSFALAGCRKARPQASAPSAKAPTIVCFVPAATDLLLAMGAGDHLVGVSNFDHDPRVAALPRVGDYLTTDWERLAALRPRILITQFPLGRIPAGLSERATALSITQQNLQIHRLPDIFSSIEQIGGSADEIEKARMYEHSLRARLQAVQARVSGLAPIRTLVVIDDAAHHVAGTGNYLDDMLQLAGGVNAMPPSDVPWPAIDREQLLALAPAAVLQLLPDASIQVQSRAMENWKQLPTLPAVVNHRILLLTDSRVLLPGDAVGYLAERFAEALHPTKQLDQ